MFQNTCRDAVFSSPLVRSPQPKKRVCAVRRWSIRTGGPISAAGSGSGSPLHRCTSSTSVVPSRSANETRSGSSVTTAFAAAVSISTRPDSPWISASTGSHCAPSVASEAYSAGRPWGK